MTKEDKELLSADLCARLPYGVRMKGVNEDFELSTSTSPKRLSYVLNSADFKPYLRPMSSMTEKEQKEYDVFCCKPYLGIDETTASNFINWLNAHHFDYRDLINMGLALEAPEDMYK